MTITIDSRTETRLRERAAAEGLTVAAYLERLVDADQSAEDEIESLALEGLNSGDPIEASLEIFVHPRSSAAPDTPAVSKVAISR